MPIKTAITKPKFTPGPWEIIHGKSSTWVGGRASDQAAQDAGFRDEVCSILEHGSYGLTKKDKANARLIAAAPEMYKALEDFISHYEDGATMREMGVFALQVKLILTKARGEK